MGVGIIGLLRFSMVYDWGLTEMCITITEDTVVSINNDTVQFQHFLGARQTPGTRGVIISRDGVTTALLNCSQSHQNWNSQWNCHLFHVPRIAGKLGES